MKYMTINEVEMSDNVKRKKEKYSITDDQVLSLVNCPYCKGMGFERYPTSKSVPHCRIEEHYKTMVALTYYNIDDPEDFPTLW
jgi:hypothetical protein